MVERFDPVGDHRLLAVRVPNELSRYVVQKGSITVNGASLTVNAIEADVSRVNLIPHTIGATNLQHSHVGAKVNLEADLLARYIERIAAADAPSNRQGLGRPRRSSSEGRKDGEVR